MILSLQDIMIPNVLNMKWQTQSFSLCKLAAVEDKVKEVSTDKMKLEAMIIYKRDHSQETKIMKN